ncbi:aminodeoxychorismate synthase component I [Plastorhodobacter daqingensis]|uniref:Aminodeoxychorismate synthase component I n=1 Tax=Plastorhodobacter daqingensis TaxID=1387281 RepID=A0ABW2UNS1_9RHOB
MILFDRGPDGRPALFDKARRLILAETPADVPDALAAMARAQAEGSWLAGYASYELGYVLEPRLCPLLPPDRRAPLLAFAVHDAPQAGRLPAAGAARLGRLVPDWTAEEYAAAFSRLAGYIAAGDCYQVNLTMPLRGRASGAPLALYAALQDRQAVGHGAYLDLGVGPVILSRSPELFFRIRGNRIETAPMKGTIPRDPDPARDVALRDQLAGSAKDRAENLMIVDLLRNDISRICKVGSVRVPALYHIESYATVHQMISRVEGELLPGWDIAGLFHALFPCGSVTGAPKIRAMEIIRELEPSPRGVYCGAIGWIAPSGDAEFNVAIRTLSLYPGGDVVLNVGGGVVQDSTAAGEYEEALWKARFARI